ncbi:MAG TPA: sigma-70 family RNA polymerase sigma factor [Planctomycetota bacterium]|nr:sigma-70 family RNA polymerase sigma factor [Planctomycetota bacterium]
MSDPRNDGRLLGLHLTGDAGAFEALTRRHAGMVLEACRRVLGPGEDAEDAAQAAFLVLLRRAGSLTGERDIGHWLHRTAVLTARNALRGRRRQARHEKEAAQMRSTVQAPDVDERPWREVAGRLDGALDTLPAAQRQALVLCYFEGLSQSQAAERAGLPESTVANRCARGLERLREALGVRDRRLAGAALAALLLARAGGGAPESLIASVAAAAKGAAAAAPVAALTEGVLRAMFWSKVKLAATAAVAVLVLGVGTPLVVRALAAEGQPAPAADPSLKPAAAPDPALAAPAANEPAAVDGLKVTLSADKAEAKAGEEISLTMTFENVSKEKLRVFWPIERFLADQVSMSATGEGVQHGAQIRNMMALVPGPDNFPELAPGEKKALTVKISGNPPTAAKLAVYFTKAGSYKVRLGYTYRDADPMIGGLEDGGKPLPGKVWIGQVQTQEVEIKLTGDFQPLPARGMLNPGGRLPRPQVRPMKQGVPAPAPGEIEAM